MLLITTLCAIYSPFNHFDLGAFIMVVSRSTRLVSVAIFLLATWTLPATAFPPHPNPKWTAGSICTPKDRDFEEYRYSQHIPYCERNVDKSQKSEIYELYGIPMKCRSSYIIDHFIPLSIGGSNKPENLWPQHHKLKELFTNVEQSVFEDVRDDRMKQEEAIKKVTEAKMNYGMIPLALGACD